MASTNKTTHYNLSQYVGTDKPTYLVDYNSDMSNIDTGIYNAQAQATLNETAIGDLSTLDTTAKSSLVNAINEVNTNTDSNTTNIGNLSNLTTTANTNLVSAINEVDSEADTNTTAIGTLANLETVVKTNLVGAVNEINSNVGDLSTLDTSTKTSLVGAVNEIIGNESYSETEVKTNKVWIDGSPIYRKVINFGNLPNNSTKRVSHNISNLGRIIRFDAISSYQTTILPIPYVSDTTAYDINIYFTDTEIDIATYFDRSSYTAYIVLEYTKSV